MRSPGSIVRLVLGWLAVIALAIAAGIWAAERERGELIGRLVDMAETCAVSFASDDTFALTGTRADLESDAYRAVKRRLQRLHDVSPAVRFVYLFRSTDQPGRVVFLADSEPADSKDVSLPGDDYPEALESPGLQEILRTFAPTTEGPLRDSFGEWVTAYAPVGDRALPGAPRVILGVDMDSSDWRRELLKQGIASGAVVLLLLGLPMGAWQFLSRERKLSREIRRLSAAIQQSNSAVIITSPDRVIEYANHGCLSATGYKLIELIGQPAGVLLPDDTTVTEREALVDRLRSGESWQGELRLRRRSGNIFPVRGSLSPVRDSSGHVTNIIAVLDDISDLKRTENALRLAREQAESADRAKGEFLAVMSHELRTPLDGIIGFATLLQDTPLSSEQADYADTIRRSGEALLGLTNELLDYSRIDAGRMQLDLQVCSPRQVVEEAVELLSTRAADKQLELLVSIAPEVPSHVMADPGRLRQVLVNLIGNAVKFTPAGEVEVELTATPLAPGAQPRVQLGFTVRDTGIGISVEKQDRLFKPFSQVDASSTRKHGGAGLGLAISRSLVQLMEGDIEVASAAGAGSSFQFKIPARVIEEAVALPTLPRRTAVVISTNSRARRHYARLLERWGLKVHTYENLTRLPAQPDYDVLVVDVPARDAALWPGLLRAHHGLVGVPVVGLVSVSVPGSLRDELRECFRALLKKPLRDSLFHAVLHSVLKP